jgi:hypothetical protein
MNSNILNTELVIKPCNAVQLGKAYGVSKKVMLRWLQPYSNCIGQRTGHKFSIEQLLIIIEMLGPPIQSVE